MDGIFADLLLEGWLVIYINDILIFSTDPIEHQQRTKTVLQHLKKPDLFLKPEKCFFDVSEVKFLGFILQLGHIGMAEDKVAAVLNWPKIDSVKALQWFLESKWSWTDDHKEAVNQFEEYFMKQPLLVQPDVTKPFRIESNASLKASGGILSQKKSGG
ncbi:uncharacterized protein FIBRA_09575 [Fibroporia radiculosa]|uniref:Reverse transcriptase domain-containing protein n=1 Tax=Fibroporia radiculosa TaxID=599839 RepID=J7RWC1_9APHY|nr:uncharacterized protein FIBRA_09575 [Fibroporia radiculosa]CCM07230.1 predicted protein [Fibroporia radiculosa]